MIKIGVLVSGGGTNLQAIIDNTKNRKIDGRVSLIISNKQDAYGLTRGKRNKIKSLFIDPKDFNSMEEYNRRLAEEFKRMDVDLIVLAGYLKVLSREFIENFLYRIINIHPSLLPSFSGKGFYGEYVHQAVLDRGVKYTGATVHFVDEGTDTGPIILQEIVKVAKDETLDTLKKKVLEVEHKLLVEAVSLFSKGDIELDGNKVILHGGDMDESAY